MPQHSGIRASDADREHVADRLRAATAEGRLLAEELEDRLGAVFSARTYGELEAVVADLPAQRLGRPSTTPVWVKGTFALAVVMAIVAVAAVVILVAMGLAGAWVLWVLFAWILLGRRGRVCRRGHSGNRARALRDLRAGPGVPGGRPSPYL